MTRNLLLPALLCSFAAPITAAQLTCGPAVSPAWPGVDNDLVLHLGPETGVQHGLSKLVEIWSDASAAPAPHDVVQTISGSYRPRLVPFGAGGHPELHHDGNDVLVNASIPLSDYSKLVVFTLDEPDDPDFARGHLTLIAGAYGHKLYLHYDGPTDAWYPAATHDSTDPSDVLVLPVPIVPGEPTILVATYTPGTDGLYLFVRDRAGLQADFGSLKPLGADDELRVGAFFRDDVDRDLIDEGFQGSISEVLVYDRKITVPEFTALQSYLYAKYLDGLLEPRVRFDTTPKDAQLYARDVVSNQAEIPVAGAVRSAGFDSIRLEVFEGDWTGPPVHTETAALTYAGAPAEAPFAFTYALTAGLTEAHFRVTLLAGACGLAVLERENVVAGDVYLIHGQSNAFAADFRREGVLNDGPDRDFIRSFGSNNPGLDDRITFDIKRDLHWDRAFVANSSGTPQSSDQIWYDHASVGSWGLEMARDLVARYGIPVAVVNAAVGGMRMQWQVRNEAEPMKLDGGFSEGRTYGRLLYRAREARGPGASESIQARALLWFQGESDRLFTLESWQIGITDLRSDWLEDYPALEAVYVFQIRTTLYCGFFRVPNTQILEAQRQVPDLPGMSDVHLLTTQAIPDIDQCHFRYHDGYETIARNTAATLARDLYGETVGVDAIDPPNVQKVEWVDPVLRDKLRLTFSDRSGGTPQIQWTHWQPFGNICEPYTDLYLRLDDPDVTIRARRTVVSGNTVTLSLVGETPSSATTISYWGDNIRLRPPCPDIEGLPWITNERGVGALTFFDVPIE